MKQLTDKVSEMFREHPYKQHFCVTHVPWNFPWRLCVSSCLLVCEVNDPWKKISLMLDVVSIFCNSDVDIQFFTLTCTVMRVLSYKFVKYCNN